MPQTARGQTGYRISCPSSSAGSCPSATQGHTMPQSAQASERRIQARPMHRIVWTPQKGQGSCLSAARKSREG